MRLLQIASHTKPIHLCIHTILGFSRNSDELNLISLPIHIKTFYDKDLLFNYTFIKYVFLSENVKSVWFGSVHHNQTRTTRANHKILEFTKEDRKQAFKFDATW